MVDTLRTVRNYRQRHEPLRHTSGNVNTHLNGFEETRSDHNRCIRESNAYARDGYFAGASQPRLEPEDGWPSSRTRTTMLGDRQLSDTWNYVQNYCSAGWFPEIRLVGGVIWFLQDSKDVEGRPIKQWKTFADAVKQGSRYNNYKKRKRRDRDKKTGEEVWPPHYEEAYMLGTADLE